jgi:Mrp family chromosome partitioning ATPase
VVLVDTPAAACGPDLQLFAAFGGGALVVTRRAASPHGLARLRLLLAGCKARVVGTVITRNLSPT